MINLTSFLVLLKSHKTEIEERLSIYGYRVIAYYLVGSTCTSLIKNARDIDIAVYTEKVFEKGLKAIIPRNTLDGKVVDYHLITKEKLDRIKNTPLIWIEYFGKTPLLSYDQNELSAEERMKVGEKEIKTNYKTILTNEKKRILRLIEKENYNNPRTLKPFYHLFGLIYIIDNNFTNNFSDEQQQMLQYLHDYILPPQFKNQLDFYNYSISEIDRLLK